MPEDSRVETRDITGDQEFIGVNPVSPTTKSCMAMSFAGFLVVGVAFST
jgi:hypothetical protein